jgi:anti-anti-sigma factor
MYPLEIRSDHDGVLWLSGEFDLAGMEPFLRTATANVDGGREVILDLSELTFLDSSGIRAILRFGSFVCPKGLVLRNPSEGVGTVLAIAGIDGLPGVMIDRQHPMSPEDRSAALGRQYRDAMGPQPLPQHLQHLPIDLARTRDPRWDIDG